MSDKLRKQACLACHNVKMRCDRNRPRCGRCSRLGRQCIYPKYEKRRKVSQDKYGERLGPGHFATGSPSLTIGSGKPPPTPNQQQQPPPPGMSASEFHMSSVHLEHLPSDQVHALNMLYFTNYGDLRPFIHPQRFLKLRAQDTKGAHAVLQYAVLALAAFLDPSSPLAAMKDAFYRKAKGYVAEYFEHQLIFCVEIIQTMVLLAYYEQCHGRLAQYYDTAMRAMRWSLRMGMHRLDDPVFDAGYMVQYAVSGSGPTNFIEREECRRTFWVVWLHDLSNSSSNVVPKNVELGEIDLQLPCEDQNWFDGIDSSGPSILPSVFTQDNEAMSSFSALIRVGNLSSMASDIRDRPRYRDKREYESAQLTLELQLANFKDTLPNHLRYDPNAILQPAAALVLASYAVGLVNSRRNRLLEARAAGDQERAQVAAARLNDAVEQGISYVKAARPIGLPKIGSSFYYMCMVMTQCLIRMHQVGYDVPMYEAKIECMFDEFRRGRTLYPIAEIYLKGLEIGYLIDRDGSTPDTRTPLSTDEYGRRNGDDATISGQTSGSILPQAQVESPEQLLPLQQLHLQQAQQAQQAQQIHAYQPPASMDSDLNGSGSIWQSETGDADKDDDDEESPASIANPLVGTGSSVSFNNEQALGFDQIMETLLWDIAGGP